MPKKWNEMVNIIENLRGQVSELQEEKRKLMKIISERKGKLKVSEKNEAVINVKLENFMKSVKKLNLGTSKLDQILIIGKSNGDHVGVSYTGESFISNALVFFQGAVLLMFHKLLQLALTPTVTHEGKIIPMFCYRN